MSHLSAGFCGGLWRDVGAPVVETEAAEQDFVPEQATPHGISQMTPALPLNLQYTVTLR